MDGQMMDERIRASKLVASAKDLAAYKRAYVISLTVHKASLTFPKIEQFALGDQIRRASKSICANLSEGFARQAHSSAEFGRFVSMAIGSAAEMLTWIDYCKDLGYVLAEDTDHWSEEYKIILKMLQKLNTNI